MDLFIEITENYFYYLIDGSPWVNKNNKLKQLKIYKNGYYFVKRKCWHRLVYEHFKGPIPENMQVDHKDNNPSNNLIKNLQLLNNKDNSRKQKKRSTNKTGYAGTSWSKNAKKFRANIQTNGITKNLGYFDTKEEAFVCYLENKIYYHGWDSILPLI